ncbi:lytic murein transglycosylase [Curvibacter sp. HBC61]|uniref:Lytic murein transglycosylase n=1 Tax=Curvibacter cyanobacteriorum TaxID=3026422 RepID=A0ABT5MZL0_9BURK|nr:lytic murein transglycosylase [Curvibacter sp. HBC61]MDD0839523.1 lytic murein transglycosylase [Curvibacter sp. HBC61]
MHPSPDSAHPTPPPPLQRLAWSTLLCAALAACGSAPTATDNRSAQAAPPLAAPATTPAPTANTAVTAAGAATSGTTNGDSEAAQQQALLRWVEAFKPRARAAGISEATLQQALDGVRYRPEVVDADRAQPEFNRTVWDYLDRAVSPLRIQQGRAKLRQLQTEAQATEARYGVPATTLFAIWGMESNYGSHYGNLPTIDALATLGLEGRREAWAREQLIAALKILQNGDIPRDRMIGSWAGAMGQTQFLPSVFLAHAVDADGDGHRDIWGSMPDVLASTANFVAHSGWKPGQAWGAEVRLPAGFDPGQRESDFRQSSAQWAAEGVQSIDSQGLPDLGDGAALFLPAGLRGPAFLVGPNFRTLLRYNNSTHYALAVSLLAQRLAQGPGVLAPWPRDLVALSRSQMRELQTRLNALGFASGQPDGLMGPATREGIRRYQRSLGLPADGYPELGLLERLQAR